MRHPLTHAPALSSPHRLSDACRHEAPVASQETMLAIARERVCADLEQLSEFIGMAAMPPASVEPSAHFGPISTDRLIAEVLMSQRANDKQLAEGWKELRRRFIAEHEEEVQRDFERMLAEEQE